jgi:drug/metabolite transporter (DMT)-like permease
LPALLLLLLQVEYFAYHKTVSRSKLCAIALLMFGITIATVSDKQVSSNPLGILVAGLAVLSSSLYQVRCSKVNQHVVYV